jgi:bifunctional DNA-binding transcriptional regulator/antitoxin component of YhaV-PrlF toxin-antitoxin module
MATQEKVAVSKIFSVRIGKDGSIPVPKELLEAVQWQPDDEVLVFAEKGRLVVMTRQQLADLIAKLLQEALKDANVDELLKELERGREDEPERL